MKPPLPIIIIRFTFGIAAAVAAFVIANGDQITNKLTFVCGLVVVIANYVNAFFDRSIAQHTQPDLNIENEDSSNEILQKFVEITGIDLEQAKTLLEKNREFVEESVAKWNSK